MSALTEAQRFFVGLFLVLLSVGLFGAILWLKTPLSWLVMIPVFGLGGWGCLLMDLRLAKAAAREARQFLPRFGNRNGTPGDG